MKLSQFRALCAREWDQESRGYVVALHLTDDSHAELTREAIMTGDMPGLELFINKLDAGDVCCGAAVSSLQNPLTRSVVKLTPGSTWDTFEVRRPVPYKLLEPAEAGSIPA